LLQIIKLIPDLPSFRNLQQASQTVTSLFNECAAEITEAIITKSLSEQVQGLIRAIAVVRSKSVASQSLDEFVNSYLGREKACRMQIWNTTACLRKLQPTAEHRPSSCESCGMTPIVHSLSSSISATVARGIVQSAYQIDQLSRSCLQTMISRCMALEPSHLANPAYTYKNMPGYDRHPQPTPLGTRYVPQNSGPPSWIEQQRVERALWRVQLYLDLRDAAEREELRWSAGDIKRLQSMNLESFWNSETFGKGPYEQMRSVVHFWQESDSAAPSKHFFWKARHQLAQVETQFEFETPVPQHEKSFELDEEAPGQVFMSGPFVKEGSPMRGADFTFYRRLGCYIWSLERMVALELLNKSIDLPLPEDMPRQMRTHDLWFTWESLLSKEERDAKERRRLASFPRSTRNPKMQAYWKEPMPEEHVPSCSCQWSSPPGCLESHDLG
jgi:hypothetical protein